MSTNSPLPFIAIPSYPRIKKGKIRHWHSDTLGVPIRYVESLRRAGAQEVIVLAEDFNANNVDTILDRLDGLLLLGGGDIDPKSYGEAATKPILASDLKRDQAELDLLRGALERKMPILGICRGHQLLNVALGGTLDQDISGRTDLDAHGKPGLDDGEVMHDVIIEPATRLSRAVGFDRLSCSSHHHQIVTAPGIGLRVTARTSDGVIEATEYSDPNLPWVVSVQWHPEDTTASDPGQQSIFNAFVKQAKGSRDLLNRV